MKKFSVQSFTPQTAILLALLFSIATLLVDGPWPLLGFALTAAAVWLRLVLGTQSRLQAHLMPVGLALLVTTWSMLVTQGMFYFGPERTLLLTLIPAEVFPFGEPPGLHIYQEGLVYGLVQSLRLDVMVFLAAALMVRFGPDQLAAGFRALRFPAAVTFLFSLGVRFVPTMWQETKAVWRTQRLRGFRLLALPGQGNGLTALPWVILLPLLFANLRRAEEIALALGSRGITAGEHGLERPQPMQPAERWLIGAALLALTGLALGRSSYGASVVLYLVQLLGGQ